MKKKIPAKRLGVGTIKENAVVWKSGQ